MLVFSRKRDEAIIIGDGIEVKVLRIGKDGVRLGVTAAPNVPVHRREIYDQIRAANTAAAAAVGGGQAEQIVARLRGRMPAGTPAPAADPAPPPASSRRR